MNYTEYQFTISPKEPWGEILTALLAELAFESFTETSVGINAYIRSNEDDENAVLEITKSIEGIDIQYKRTEIEQKNWNQEWESNFQPILVNDQCYIRAEFHPEKPEIPYEVIIQPKMSFGTGHHETTHLMVEYILETKCNGKSVLDMGCGTSILAILAKMKGADYVEGIDIDEWSVENSIENAKRNQVDIIVKLGDVSQLGNKNFDLILANINRNILMADLPEYIKNTNPNAEIILSGLMEFDYEDIKKRGEELGLTLVSKKQRNEWIALKWNKE
ncbi:MAG: 50S ribosomal protein L11 methyltransferase [Weeksellaceae bacterium]|jgi:ribosomal protein L11 methyltransferase|nr:50S ribosomal protein L11 methyltransferase [Weeksellaceae bacterium]